jgi:hypothetical protein
MDELCLWEETPAYGMTNVENHFMEKLSPYQDC